MIQILPNDRCPLLPESQATFKHPLFNNHTAPIYASGEALFSMHWHLAFSWCQKTHQKSPQQTNSDFGPLNTFGEFLGKNN